MKGFHLVFVFALVFVQYVLANFVDADRVLFDSSKGSLVDQHTVFTGFTIRPERKKLAESFAFEVVPRKWASDYTISHTSLTCSINPILSFAPIRKEHSDGKGLERVLPQESKLGPAL
ncbi:uncharacterized protein UTRI_03630 [Ustilago trichophora]|uniref:Uncharacterized protein n=1 Tax=Ustilago trichophora TaxID=86804 RepID=A0A5C3E1N9_9BASI|nr:uncharacterized protein UTRI_03630 [Ustilago trichophora]